MGTEWLEGNEGHWAGWIELVPAIHTPRFQDLRDETSVYLNARHLDEGAGIRLSDPSNRSSLLLPAGAEIDRVERFLIDGVRKVVDVRGTRFDQDGVREHFHAYRPSRDGRLFGVEWERSADPPSEVVHAFREAMAGGEGLAGVGQERQAAAARRFERLLECSGCHVAGTPPRVGGVAAWPRRPTDASGLYSVLSVLSDVAVLETYRPRETNAERAFVSVGCTPIDDPTQQERFAIVSPCPEGFIAAARVNTAEGVRASDPDVLRLCASRRALIPLLSADVRLAFARELSACEGSTEQTNRSGT